MANRKKKQQHTAQIMAVAALMTSTIAPYAVQAEEIEKANSTDNLIANGSGENAQTDSPTDDITNSSILSTGLEVTDTDTENTASPHPEEELDNIAFLEENVDFQFTAGTDFETGNTMDSYFKAFAPSADLVIGKDGKAYADITFAGHSYAIDTLKVGGASGELANIISSTGSVATKDLVRVVRVALDEDYRAAIFLESAKGNYTFLFDLVEEKTKFEFTSGTANDAYFSAWVPSADIVKAADGKKYAYVTLAGHSYAVPTIKVGSVDGTDAEIISSTGSSETGDLVRVVRLALDENNKAALYLEAGTKGAYTFSFDFTQKDVVKIEDLLTEESQSIAFKYSAATSWHPMAFPANLIAAAAKKVANQFEVTLQVATEDLNSFTVTQDNKEVAVWSADSSLVTFTVDSLAGLSFASSKTASEKTTELAVNVDEISLNSDRVLPTQTVGSSEPETPKKPVVETRKDIKYTMKADPNGQMAEFITNYLSPYFSNAQLITVGDEKFVELTLTGKAYGFTKLQYIDATGTNQDVKTISSEGEKLEQLRVIRVPLIQDEDSISKIFVDSGDLGYGTYTLFFKFDVPATESGDGATDAGQPTTPVTSTENEVAVTKPEQLPADKEIPVVFNFTKPTISEPSTDPEKEPAAIIGKIQKLVEKATAKKVEIDGKAKIQLTLPITPQEGINKLLIKQGGKTIGEWKANSVARVASLFSAAITVAATSNELILEVDSLEGLTFEAYDTVGATTPLLTSETTVVTAKENVTESDSNTDNTESDNSSNTGNNNTGSNTGNTTGSTGSTGSIDFNNIGTVTEATSISHTISATMQSAGIYGAVDGNFISDYLGPYFNNTQLVTVDGKKYIQITLTGKAYGVSSISGATVVSSTGEGLNQVRVIRIPVAKTSTHYINAGEYGTYNLTFSFNVTDEQLAGADTVATDKPATETTDTVDIQSSGDATFKLVLTNENKEFTKHVNSFTTTYKDGKYKVDIALNTANTLTKFIVKQNGKELATWNKNTASAKLASLFGFFTANTNTATLSFETTSLEGITLEATTPAGTHEAATQATSNVKKETDKTEETAKPADGEIAYTMEADPNGPMAEFITSYLAPYFSKAKPVTIDGKQYIEMTLTGKAYGFATLQYVETNGKQHDVTIVSSTGEKLNQVRVIRIPLIQDENGITKIFVDSGEAGYGAYTLFFKFDVQVTGDSNESTATNPEILNPFTDIEGLYSADEILALYGAGITTGKTATTYSPYTNITRAQFAAMIARALDVKPSKQTKFTDIKGKWYEEDVQALQEIGIITGTSETTFNPTKAISRQQAATMIFRMLEYKGYKATSKGTNLNYTDVSKVASYAKAALAELQVQDIMTGSKGAINPTNSLTRAQMAKILKRSLDLIHYEW